MAGKKMRSRKTNSHNQGYERYKNHNTKAANKLLKAARHEKRVAEMAEHSEKKTAIVTELITSCNNKFKLGKEDSRAKYILKRVLGTLTPNKINFLLEGDITKEAWFQKRPATPELRKMLGNTTKLPSGIIEAMREVPSIKNR